MFCRNGDKYAWAVMRVWGTWVLSHGFGGTPVTSCFICFRVWYIYRVEQGTGLIIIALQFAVQKYSYSAAVKTYNDNFAVHISVEMKSQTFDKPWTVRCFRTLQKGLDVPSDL